MIFEIEEGIFVDSDEIRMVKYLQCGADALREVNKSWVVSVSVKGSDNDFFKAHLTKEEAKSKCGEYVQKWNAAKRESFFE